MKRKQLATDILEEQVHSFVSDSAQYARPYSKYREMAKLDDVTPLAYTDLVLLVVSMIGSYISEDENAVRNVENSFLYSEVNTKDPKQRQAIVNSNMRSLFAECMSYIPFGFAYAGLAYDFKTFGEATLSRYMFFEPEYVQFDGTRQSIKKVYYRGTPLEYNSKIHLINEPVLAGYSPYGLAALDRGLRSWEMHKIFMSAYAVAGQKQATKLLIGKTDTEREIEVGKKADGSPMTAYQGDLMEDALKGAGNSSYIVVGREDEITAVDQTVDSDWFLKAFYRGDSTRFRMLGFPQTSYAGNEGATKGVSSLAASQQENLLMYCEGLAEYVARQVENQALHPMLSFNGHSTNGRYTIDRQNPKALLIADKIIAAMKDDMIQDKESAEDRLKSLLGI
jgi:hypothetical protein